jgi:hypothetical protein
MILLALPDILRHRASPNPEVMACRASSCDPFLWPLVGRFTFRCILYLNSEVPLVTIPFTNVHPCYGASPARLQRMQDTCAGLLATGLPPPLRRHGSPASGGIMVWQKISSRQLLISLDTLWSSRPRCPLWTWWSKQLQWAHIQSLASRITSAQPGAS